MKKKKSITKKEELILELDGKVFIIEKKNGKVKDKRELDGTLVLLAVKDCIERGISIIENGKT